jgi:hypothetical protein
MRESHSFSGQGLDEKRSWVCDGQGCRGSGIASFLVDRFSPDDDQSEKSFTLVFADQRIGLGMLRDEKSSRALLHRLLRSGGDDECRCDDRVKVEKVNDVLDER